MWVNPVPIAFRAVAAGMSGRQGLLAARAAGVAIRDATWFQIYGRARAAVAVQIGESSLSLGSKPRSSQIAEMSTKNAQGFIQYVEVYVRDKETGIVSTRPFAVRGQDLQTRNDVVNKALSRFHGATTRDGNYPTESVLGAAYTATYKMTPL